MGVWIETLLSFNYIYIIKVTPFVGVWIETSPSAPCLSFRAVTPFVGVWIETGCWCDGGEVVRSHPSWVCGLKRKDAEEVEKQRKVTPFVGVWIETEKKKKSVDDSRVTPFVGVWIETFLR